MANTLIIPPYRAALLTNADGSPVVRASGPDSEPVLTEKQWYMFWRDVASQLNAGAQAIEGLGNIVTFGNHADRPDPGPWPDGALYVEWDRGSVIYQNQGGTWVFIAGQMFGTLSPDQRPADLGPPDVGFPFRTTTDPARSFAWSGVAWIETTPIRYGTHAARLAAPIAGLVSGMLWMETDRGSVIYQNQGGTWLYLAGTMWDTMSPDHRPTDLGVHDAGFDYRSTDPPPREFVWNQVAWVEATNISGAPGLTHPNVVTKVGAVGQIVEGGITDESAANSDRVHVTAAGNVGIGTPTAIQSLAGRLYVTIKGTSDAGVLELAHASADLDGSFAGIIQIVDPGTVAADKRVAMIANSLDGSTANNRGGAIRFYTKANGASGVVERMRISNLGQVGIGLTPSFQFQLASDSAGKPTTSTWSVVSDLRLKQNVEPVKNDSLAILDKLEWIRYEYNGQAGTPKGARGIGLVAQTLREQMPEAVRSTKTKLRETDAEETDVLAIDYHYVLVHSARAIQQLSAEVKRLAALLGNPA